MTVGTTAIDVKPTTVPSPLSSAHAMATGGFTRASLRKSNSSPQSGTRWPLCSARSFRLAITSAREVLNWALGFSAPFGGS